MTWLKKNFFLYTPYIYIEVLNSLFSILQFKHQLLEPHMNVHLYVYNIHVYIYIYMHGRPDPRARRKKKKNGRADPYVVTWSRSAQEAE